MAIEKLLLVEDITGRWLLSLKEYYWVKFTMR